MPSTLTDKIRTRVNDFFDENLAKFGPAAANGATYRGKWLNDLHGPYTQQEINDAISELVKAGEFKISGMDGLFPNLSKY